MSVAIPKCIHPYVYSKMESELNLSQNNNSSMIVPEEGLISYDSGTTLKAILCKPKILPIKSFSLERLEELEKKIKKNTQKRREEEKKKREKEQNMWGSATVTRNLNSDLRNTSCKITSATPSPPLPLYPSSSVRTANKDVVTAAPQLALSPLPRSDELSPSVEQRAYLPKFSESSQEDAKVASAQMVSSNPEHTTTANCNREGKVNDNGTMYSGVADSSVEIPHYENSNALPSAMYPSAAVVLPTPESRLNETEDSLEELTAASGTTSAPRGLSPVTYSKKDVSDITSVSHRAQNLELVGDATVQSTPSFSMDEGKNEPSN